MKVAKELLLETDLLIDLKDAEVSRQTFLLKAYGASIRQMPLTPKCGQLQLSTRSENGILTTQFHLFMHRRIAAPFAKQSCLLM